MAAKTEEWLHEQVCIYLRYTYPSALFNTDLSGVRLTQSIANRVSRLRSCNSFPDIFIIEPRLNYHGLFIELKRDGTRVLLRDGSLTRDKHIREQAVMLFELRRRGFFSSFAIGYTEAKRLIDWYFGDGRSYPLPDYIEPIKKAIDE